MSHTGQFGDILYNNMFSCQDISCIYIILFRKIKVKNITVSSLWNVHTLFLSIDSWQFTDSRLCVSATVRRLGRSRDLLCPPSTKFRGYIGITLSVRLSVCLSVYVQPITFFVLTLVRHIWHMGLSPWDNVSRAFMNDLWRHCHIYRVFNMFSCPAHTRSRGGGGRGVRTNPPLKTNYHY